MVVQALALDPEYWPALESLENVKSLAVDRWHFRMLNHSARNEAYARAIKRAVADAASDGGRSEVNPTVYLPISATQEVNCNGQSAACWLICHEAGYAQHASRGVVVAGSRAKVKK